VKKRTVSTKPAVSYKHSEATSPMRPEVGTQTRFKKKLPPAKFRYDDSLSPVMEWDGQNVIGKMKETAGSDEFDAAVELAKDRKVAQENIDAYQRGESGH
jgi:hypothetical protein